MVEFDDFSEEDWRDLLAELRLLVVSAGFEGWDIAMVTALEEHGRAPLSARNQVRAYASRFGRFLEVRSAKNMKLMRVELGSLLKNESGDPVTDAIVIDEARKREQLVLGDEPSDFLVEAFATFVKAIDGEGGDFDGRDEIEE